MKNTLIAMTAVGLAGCASPAGDIPAAYVSPVQYQNYSCDQIAGELRLVGRRVSELQGSLDEEASADSAQMAIGLVIFWPALFFLEGGDGPEAQEYARLRGERDALEQMAVQKDCGLAVMDARMPGSVPQPREPDLREFMEGGRADQIGRSAEARVLPVLRQAYADCTIDALLGYNEANFRPISLARKAHSDCASEFDLWQDSFIGLGADRARATSAFARAKEAYVDELGAYIEEFRANGIALTRIRG